MQTVLHLHSSSLFHYNGENPREDTIDWCCLPCAVDVQPMTAYAMATRGLKEKKNVSTPNCVTDFLLTPKNGLSLASPPDI